ncbi:MAG: hypothetical protein K0R64_1104 [Novosphingobium lindaniclasticum]|uniref:UrcA family protein n=1 Tax=Novosphingobium lindaniclasticum TaxID=1329895 RepID=UPI002409826F|nr:UrcA family protein [Novosphingobium lindaniclasticum]MDF2638120.1 hypothetical protein [Novosphingobium lindaniclasticum]
MTRIHTTFAAIGLLAIAATGFSTPAFADVIVKDGSLRDVPHREVRFGDLNLDSQAGLDTLNMRLEIAVRAVCPIHSNQLEEMSWTRDCRDASRDRAFAARDAMLANRLAARENPSQFAQAAPTSLAIVARRGR